MIKFSKIGSRVKKNNRLIVIRPVLQIIHEILESITGNRLFTHSRPDASGPLGSNRQTVQSPFPAIFRTYFFKIYELAILFLASGILLVVQPSIADAKEMDFKVSLERNVIALGRSVQLSLTFQGTQDIPRPELPEIDGFQLRYLGPSTRMSIVNGRMSSSIIHMYTLIPLKTGKFSIGPFSFDYKGDTYTSNTLNLEVVDRPVSSREPVGGSQAEGVEPGDRVFLEMTAGKNRVYMNEVVPLTIKLYVSSLSVRDIQYPVFEHEGFLAEEFEKPKQYQEQRGGRIYEIIEFNTKLFGTRPGEFSLGYAELKANLLIKKQRRRHSSLFDNFFGGYETSPIELKSDALSLKVLPFPENGKPEDFSGAVGDFDLSVEVLPEEVKQGDPVTVRMVVSGNGNFNTVTSPRLKYEEDFKVYDPQVTQQGNRKVFEQILIPLSDSIREIPAVSFSFFDPGKERYRTLSKSPILIAVKKREKEEITFVEGLQAVEKILSKEKLGRDIIYIKESPGRLKKRGDYLYKNPAFIIIQFVPVILFISAMIIQRRRERLRTDIVYARRLSAPRKATKGIRKAEGYLKNSKSEEFYGSVYKTLQEYIGDRYHIPAGGITSDIVDTSLMDKSIDKGILVKLKSVFKECDLARYASSGLVKADMEKTLKDLREIINYMEKHKS